MALFYSMSDWVAIQEYLSRERGLSEVRVIAEEPHRRTVNQRRTT
jgi:hypothetical protein